MHAGSDAVTELFSCLPALHGRDAERETVREALVATLGGRGGALLIEGAPGIGKTRLLDEAARLARELGVRPLAGSAHEAQRAMPFAPLIDALLSDPAVFRPGAVPTRGASDQAFWFTYELQNALERAAAEAPIAVLLDDLQWADSPSLQTIRAATLELAGSPVLWVLALRSHEGGPALRAAVSQLERAGVHRIGLGLLSPAAMQAAVREVVGAEPDDVLLELVARAEGNPHLLVELLLGLRDEERLRVRAGRVTTVGARVPGRLTQTMHEQLDQMAPLTRQVLRAAAALGHECTAHQLAAVLHVRPLELVEALDEVLRANLLVETRERLAFRHDLLREAVLDALTRPARHALQREAAAVLLDHGAPPVAVARQLAACAEHGDQSAIATLRAAARNLEQIDSETAADLLVRALELMPAQDGERGTLVAETVVALHRALRAEEARKLAQRALGGALAPAVEANVRLSLARLMQVRPDVCAGESEIALALSDVPLVTRARHRAWLAYNRALDGHVEHARRLLEVDDDAGDLETRVVTGIGLAVLELLDGACTSALERVNAVDHMLRQTPTAPSPFTALVAIHRVGVLAQLGHLSDAGAAVLAGLADARRLRDARMVRVWTQVEGLLHAAGGRLAEARAVFGESTDTGLDTGPGTYVGIARMLTQAQVAVHTGDAGLLRVAVSAARQVSDDSSPVLRGMARGTLALAAAMRGDARLAISLVIEEPPRFAMPLVPASASSQALMVRFALFADYRELAEGAAAAAETYAGLNPGAPVLAGVAAHARALIEADATLAVEAARVLAATERPLLHALAAEDAGLLLARDGHPSAAVTLLTEAFDTYHAVGAAADVRRVVRQLHHFGAGRRLPALRDGEGGWESLSDAELNVVRVVAEGATNRDAAEQLYLSPHTVSSHVRNAFRKLGINSRVELAAIAAQRR